MTAAAFPRVGARPRALFVWGSALAALASLAAFGLYATTFTLPTTTSSRPQTEEVSAAAREDLIALTAQPFANPLAEGLEARRINASLPFSASPVEAASAFTLAGVADADRARAQLCLTQAVYYEAGFESEVGRRAVAQVVLNRLRHPAFPNSVCGVVYQGSNAPGCQFSFTCDGSLARPPSPSAWARAGEIAREALAGQVAPAVGQATHYHTDYVAPYWAPKLAKITQIGAHIFYRWPGAWGTKRAFTARYAGGEAIGSGPEPLAVETEVAEPALPMQAPDDRRAPNDVGGRLDVSKGWTLSIPDPRETRSALDEALAAQQRIKLAAVEEPGGQIRAAVQ